jgi:hypothetical protein
VQVYVLFENLERFEDRFLGNYWFLRDLGWVFGGGLLGLAEKSRVGLMGLLGPLACGEFWDRVWGLRMESPSGQPLHGMQCFVQHFFFG